MQIEKSMEQDRTIGFKPWSWRWRFKRTQYVARRGFQIRYVGNEMGLFTSWANSLVWSEFTGLNHQFGFQEIAPLPLTRPGS